MFRSSERHEEKKDRGINRLRGGWGVWGRGVSELTVSFGINTRPKNSFRVRVRVDTCS